MRPDFIADGKLLLAALRSSLTGTIGVAAVQGRGGLAGEKCSIARRISAELGAMSAPAFDLDYYRARLAALAERGILVGT